MRARTPCGAAGSASAISAAARAHGVGRCRERGAEDARNGRLLATTERLAGLVGPSLQLRNIDEDRRFIVDARRHGEIIDARFGGIDPFSSAWWFDGWKDEGWREGLAPPEERTVAEAESWLLRVGWRRGGDLIDVLEMPPAGRR